ncbi:hypothetical protein ABES02_05120 [Neobacillus pocheonensis]|uniref:hypothetical protein n=1 Tax=Neobacillus pocheonensis TaxID=363869 RepID=UPI003D26EF03
MYFIRNISVEIRTAQLAFIQKSKTRRLILAALLASIAAILQAAGGFLPGVGYFISPFATAPILLCSMLSLPLGLMAYILTNLLLLILQPSELIIFPFTTGLIGLGIGAAFYFFKKRWIIIITSASLLTIGIMILLYVLKFPVLGPSISKTFSISTAGGIFLFSVLYNWFWVDIGLIIFNRLKIIIASR